MTKAASQRKPPRRKPLLELFEEHGGKVSDKWSIYLEVYERIFAKFRTRPVRILEIGVQNGGSLEIWEKYFPQAEVIVGCDIDPDCQKLEFDVAKIRLIVGDVNSAKIEREIIATSSRYDIVIDDGSHKSSDIICSFARYFKHLAPNGVYIVEDLHCSYWQGYQGGLYDPYSSMSFFKRLLDVVNGEHWGVPRKRTDALSAFARKYSVSFDEVPLASIHSLQFMNSLCVIEKCHAIENQLGERKIGGQLAIISDGCTPLRGHLSKPSDETENPWSLDLLTLEEEIEANRKLVSTRQERTKHLQSEIDQVRHQLAQAESSLAQLRHEAEETAAARAEAEKVSARLTEHIVLLMSDLKERQAAFADGAGLARQVKQVLAMLDTSRHELATRLFGSEQARERQSTELQQQADEIAALKGQVNEKQGAARRAVGRLLNDQGSLLPWRPFRLRRQADLLKRSGLFDAEWYVRQNTDVASAGIDPLRHYIEFGAREGRAPTAALANGGTEPQAVNATLPGSEAGWKDTDQS